MRITSKPHLLSNPTPTITYQKHMAQLKIAASVRIAVTGLKF
jgi:hypothetical protein